MSNNHNDIIVLPKTPSVQVINDTHGDEWTCWDEVDSKGDLGEQGCEPSSEVTYDRGFGG